MTTPTELSAAAEAFLADPHVGAFTTLRPDGSPHTAPVCFTWDADSGLVRVMTRAASRKARNISANPGGRASVCQVQGTTWVTLEGGATVSHDPERVATGARWYAKRYGHPPPNPPGLVVVEIRVDRSMGLL